MLGTISSHHERRKFSRINVRYQVKFNSLEDFEDMVQASTEDMSYGGVYINTRHLKPVGTKMSMELPANQGKVLIDGTVRSLRYQQGIPVGMGIQFEGLDTDAAALLHALIQKSRKTDA